MGSFLGRSFVAEHSDALAGAVFSGSNGKPPPIAALGRLIARVERLRLGPRGKSPLLNQMMFGDFNKPFKPARTAFDWLSRDPAEVDLYVADPLCGFPFSTQLAVDLLDALPGLSDPSLAPIRKDLAVYVLSGEMDPVGANIRNFVDALKAAGFARLTTRSTRRPARDAERDQSRRGDAGPDRVDRRSGGALACSVCARRRGVSTIGAEAHTGSHSALRGPRL